MTNPPKIPQRKLSMPVRLAKPQNMLTLLIGQGFAFHQKKMFKEAQAIYERVLAIEENNFDALQLLGALFNQTNQFAKAVEVLNKALQINPNYAEAYSNRGNALHVIGRLEDALISYEKAISINPNYAEAYSNRGNALKILMRFDHALASYDKAISIKPNYAEAHSNRGTVLKELGRLEESLISYEKAISINPNYAEAYSNRGNALKILMRFDHALASYDKAISIKPNYAEAHSNRGTVLKELGRLEEALTSFDKALQINPNYAEAHSNRGNALKALGCFEEALVSYNKAIAIKPDYAEAYSNRGNALSALMLLDEALASYDKAISIKPNYAEAHSNRGTALKDLGCVKEAMSSFDKAISIKPDYIEAYWNLSLLNLLEGNFEAGWQGYEWRWKNENIQLFKDDRNFPLPLWLGEESLKDRTILLYAEQGYGDTIQFCRYVPLVAKLGAKVILEVQRPLVGLLKNLKGISQIIAKGDELPAFDFQCPLLSLPLAFKSELHAIPPVLQDIAADSEKIAKWQTLLGIKTKLRVGLAWSGNPKHANDHNRSITLSKLLPHLPSNIEYVCLQDEIRDVDKELLGQHPEIKYFGEKLADFADTAALCELMDLIISVDTSVAHLGGSLEKPTWVLLPFSPDWRWLLDRDDSPWYSSVKLYRQNKIGNWDDVLERVKVDLSSEL